MATKNPTIESLVTDPNNARERTDRNERALATSFERYGAGRSIVIDKDDVVRAGNGTLEAARAAGITDILVVEGKPDQLVVVRRSDWSEEEATGYGVMDNRSAELAKWNYPVLGELLALKENPPQDFGFLPAEADSIVANSKWKGLGVDTAPPERVKSGPAFAVTRIQVTVLDEAKADEVLERVNGLLEEYAEGVMVEKL